MKLRSIKLTNFLEAGSLVVTDLLEAGERRPGDSDPALIGDALRFAFTGELPKNGTVIAARTGFACVDVGLGLATDQHVSVFRGMDSRGVVHASLRERGGQHVTRGVDEVSARLAELLNGDPAERVAAVWPDEHVVDDPRYAELMDLGRRLRRERALVAAEVDAVSADQEPRASTTTRPSLFAPWAVATIASVLVTALVFVSVGPGRGSSGGVELALGFGALAAVVGSLTLTSRRLLRDRRMVARGADDSARLARLHARLEELDETVAVFTAEAGRASRALRLPMPDRRAADVGLSPAEPLDFVRNRVRDLAEALHASRV